MLTSVYYDIIGDTIFYISSKNLIEYTIYYTDTITVDFEYKNEFFTKDLSKNCIFLGYL